MHEKKEMSDSISTTTSSLLCHSSSGNTKGRSNLHVISSAISPFSPSKSDLLTFLTANELQQLIKTYDAEIKRLNNENNLFESFLERMHIYVPDGHSGQSASTLSWNSSIDTSIHAISTTLSSYKSSLGVRDSLYPSSKISITQSHSYNKRPRTTYTRLTIGFRMEMAYNELEEMRMNLEKCQQTCKKLKFKYSAEIEEKKSSLQELHATRNYLEHNILGDTKNPITSYLPAERYLRYCNDILKGEDQKLGTIRMKINSMVTMLNRIKSQLEQRIELGEMILPVDFEELQLENKDCLLSLEEKNKHLVGLKLITGRCNQNLSIKKRNLDELLVKLKKLTDEATVKEKLLIKLEKEGLKTKDEVRAAFNEHRTIEEKIKYQRAPSIMDLAKKKAYLGLLEKNIKVLTRRNKIQEITINLLKPKLRKQRRLKSSVHVTWSRMSFRAKSEINENESSESNLNVFPAL